MRATSDLNWGMPVLGEATGPIPWTSDILSDVDGTAAEHDGADPEHPLQSAFDASEEVASIAFHSLERVEDTVETTNSDLEAETVGEIDIESAQTLYDTEPEDVSEAPPAPDLDGEFPPGRSGVAASRGAAEDGEGFFEAVFGWLLDLFGSIFRGDVEAAEVEGSPTDVDEETVPDADAEDEPAPVLTGDVILIEYIPALIVGEEGEMDGSEEDDASAMQGDFLLAV